MYIQKPRTFTEGGGHKTYLNTMYVIHQTYNKLHQFIIIYIKEKNNHMILKCVFSVAPEKVTMNGPQKVVLGSMLLLECFSSPRVPVTALTWSVTIIRL